MPVLRPGPRTFRASVGQGGFRSRPPHEPIPGRGEQAAPWPHPAFTSAAAVRTNLIDYNIEAALNAAGVTPAEKTNDYEFIRRVTLD